MRNSAFTAARIAASASIALADCPAFHSKIRRLWAIENLRGIRVIVALEPTHDGNDTSPAWLANCHAWAIEMRLHLKRTIVLELIGDPSLEAIDIDGETVIVADLGWRDPSKHQHCGRAGVRCRP
jgi:hypothetical protein